MSEEMIESEKRKNGFFGTIERLGNKIPDPVIFFIGLIVIIAIASYFMSGAGVQEINPATNKKVGVFNLLSVAGIKYMLGSVVSNWGSLSVMTMTLTTMLGMALADKSGLFECLLKKLTMTNGSHNKVIVIFIFVAALADVTNGTGFVIMPILGAMVWQNLGRNPIAGMCCGYGTVAGAFAANFLLGTTDITSAGFTESAARLLVPNFEANVAMNYYYTAFSVFTLVIASYFITTKIIEPMLGKGEAENIDISKITTQIPNSNKGIRNAGIASLVYILIIVGLCVPQNSIMRSDNGTLMASSALLMKGLTFYLAILFAVPGVAFGVTVGKFKNFTDIVDALADGMTMMSRFIVLCFFIAQFLSYFAKTNIGLIMAIKGANALSRSGFPILLIFIIMILLSAALNLLIGSASTKWGVMAPVFVPMFMLLGYDPAVTQVCYRIGDAITNPITPSFAYMGMLLALAKQYDKKAGFGTMIAGLLPYTLVFSVVLIIQFAIWFELGIPLGPGGSIHFSLH